MSLPTPPSGILDKDRPWYRGKISDAQWDRLKAKLTGGTDAGGTSYSKFIDCSAAEADKIISNLKKDPRGYPQMYMPGGGESYQIMIDFYQWLKDSYLTDEPKEVEEIPVEVEVVEVEQKQPDEPIVVKIEAPFEPTPTQPLSAPKTLRLPRRSGIIRPTKRKKKSAAERMAEAFDERLDDLVDSIQNPPEPAQPKQRKQKESLVKIKKAVKPAKFKSNFREGTTGKPFDSLASYGASKIKRAFGRAADARRMAAEAGMPEQKKRFYFNRALGFELGGDRIARTRGTFSKNPDATLDPSLTKQQRYMEGMFGTRTIRPPKGGSKNTDISSLDKALNDLDKKFQAVIDTKKGSKESGEDVAALEKVTKELRDALQANNKSQTEIIKTKKEIVEFEKDAADSAQMQAQEDALEQGSKGNRYVGVDTGSGPKRQKKDGPGFNLLDLLNKGKLGKWIKRLKNPIKTAKAVARLARQKVNNFIKPAKELAKKGWNAVKNMGTMFGGALKKTGDAIGGGAKKAWNATTSAVGAVGGWIGDKVKKTGDLIASAPGKIGEALQKLGVPKNWDELVTLVKSPMAKKWIDSALGPIGRYVRDQITNPKSALRIAQAGIGNAKVQAAILKQGGEKLLTKILAKLGVKVGGQAVPLYGQVVNLAYGVVEAIVRGAMGDAKGAALSLGGAIPWVGAGFSIVDIIRDIDIDAYTQHIEPNLGSIAMGDGSSLISFFNQVAGQNITGEIAVPPPTPDSGTTPAPEQKMSRGGVVRAMIGEAGPEMLIRAGGGAMGGMNPLQSLAPMISAMREITKRAGTWADPIENMVAQATNPIAKQLNLPVVPTNVDIGKGQMTKKRKKDDNWLSKLAGFIFGGGKKKKGKKGSPSRESRGSNAGGYKQLLDMIAGVESTSSGGYEAFNTGGSDGGHTAHGSGDSSRVPIGGTVKPLSQRTVAEVMRLQSAGHLHATGRYQIIEMTLKGLMSGRYGETGVKPNDLYDALTQDKLGIALIKGRLRTGANLENFRNEWIGLHHVPDEKLQAAIDGANQVYKANPNATAVGTSGSVSSGGSIRAVGDSLAQGLADSSGSVADNATVGFNPAQVESHLKAHVNKSNTSHVLLSTGLSNNPNDMGSVRDQMRYLQNQGIAFTVIPVSNSVSSRNGNINSQLESMASQYGGQYAGQLQGFKSNDGVHPTSYLDMVRKLRISG